MNKDIKNICIYGVGGVGGYFGSKMIEANINKNYNISFIARGEHLKEIKNNGLILKSNTKEIKVFPDFITDNVKEIDKLDLLIICVKSYDLQDILIMLKEQIKSHTIILPLLNGVDIYERIHSEVENGIVLPACVYVGTHITQPGVICQNGGDGKILFGKDPNNIEYYPENLIKCFNDLKINFKYEENPYKEIWTKYMFISAYGLVSAYTGNTLGKILETKELVEDVRCIMNEVKQIANKKGVFLDKDIVENSINKAKNFPYDTKTSYQRDVENYDKRNEGELFGGTIIRLGRQYNVKTQVVEKYYK